MPPRGSPLRLNEAEDSAESSERAGSPMSRGKLIFKPIEAIPPTQIRTGTTPTEIRTIDTTTFTTTFQKFIKPHLPEGVIREEHRHAQRDFNLATKLMRNYLASVHTELEMVISQNTPEDGVYEKANIVVYSMWMGITTRTMLTTVLNVENKDGRRA